MTTLFLGAIALLGIFLRIVNISPFKFYPDAYQNLIVAQNLLNYHSVFGRLGEMGMFYPYFFMWTRPGYPLLINLASLFTKNPAFSAQITSLVSGVLTIPVAYLFIRKVFSSNTAGLVAALIAAVSFNSVVWGGFIYTESTGVLLILLLLWRLFKNLEHQSKWADFNDFFTGFILSFAVFTRYEYLALIIPVAFLVLQKSPSPLKKLINIFVSSAFFASIVLSQFYPLGELAGLITFQLGKLLVIFSGFLAGFVLLLALKKINLVNLKKFEWINPILIGLFWLLALLISIQQLFGSKINFLYYGLTGTRNFFVNDFFLGLLSLAGITLMLKNKSLRTPAYFVILSAFLLFLIYYNINPQMQRYITHLLPFLLIPASFAGWKIYQLFQLKLTSAPKYPVILISVLILLACQIIFSLQGIKKWHEGSWFRLSYEEKSAKLFKLKLPEKDNHILISAMPEAYYFFTNHPTQSILEDDKYPFLDIDPALDPQHVFIIADMGMSDLFPNFNSFLEQNLGNHKIFEYWVNETYHFSIRSKVENQPVKVYEITLAQLKQKITEANLLQNQ